MGRNKLEAAVSDLEGLGKDEEEFFPGSKRKRSEPVPKPPEEVEGWDAHPIVKNLRGVETEFFTIGALAQALNKKPVTIRRWITEKVIPDARYRTNKIVGSRGDAGRRLWTRAQIEAIVNIAKEEGVFTDSSKSRSPQFKQRVLDYFKSEKKK